MEKNTGFENKKKKFISLVIGLVISVVAICFIFYKNYSRIYELLLNKDMEQIEFTSDFVTKLIQTEIENLLSGLEASQKIFLDNNVGEQDEIVELLSEIKQERHFEKIGVVNLAGISLDDTGRIEKIEDTEFLNSMRNNQNYISNVIDISDIMIIAVPITRNDEVTGAIWGYYSISKISEKIELTKDSQRYFQIIDDTGLYISSSNNVYSFAEDVNIWDEIERYEISEGITVDEIRNNVENGKSGQFHFTFAGQGRYVTYEPLGIKNWYVFSVLVEEYLGSYVKEIEEAFSYLLWGVFSVIMIGIGFIGRSIYVTTGYIKEQNEKLFTKNSLLFTVLRYTKDIPFEINLADRTLTIYRGKDEEREVCRKLDYFIPENMLRNERICLEEYDKYNAIYESLTKGKSVEPVVLKLKIDGKWDYNKLHIKTIDKNHIVGFLEDYNEQEYQNQKMEEISIKNQIDFLTTLYNREFFSLEVEKILKERLSHETEQKSALFLLDLDFFKKANDTLGHIAGDEILHKSGLVMKSIIRSTDLAGRLGGDEFVLFIKDAKDISAIQVCAEKVNKALHRTYGEGEKTVTVSVSIGIVVVTKEKTFSELYKTADLALYEAKKQGRNGYYIISGDS